VAKSDRIDSLVSQWADVRPDLDLEAMALVQRLGTAAALTRARIAELARRYGVSVEEGDILFTIRRAGSPGLSPTALTGSLMVSSGTMTNRLDHLEAKGLIERVPNPGDRRAVEIELTRKGLKLVDKAVAEHVENEVEMLSVLGDAERRRLDATLRKLIEHLAGPRQG
jgi:DNA-binding MarR family transcriptional regulator